MEQDIERIEFEAGLRCCWNILARLSETDGIGSPDLEEGECGECGREVHVRWTLGKYELCRSCRAQRHRVATRLGLPAEEADDLDWAAA